MAKSIMIQGTMSNAGKSLLAAGLCRVFKQEGLRVAPFKSQNMALNSYITREGYEMGRAQVVQAEAAGIEPSVLMNPILLKPTSERGSQVIVNGEVVGNMDAARYFAYKTKLIPVILEAYRTLAADYDLIIIEGAGSPAEINLQDADIVNMGMAKMARSPVLLVADIDRGGVFAAIYGTVMLLDEAERALIKGIVINKFRGDLQILKPGLKMIEEKVNIPVIGVLPYLSIDIEDEDSLAERLSRKTVPGTGGSTTSADSTGRDLIDIAVIRFPRMSNFTDFNVFKLVPGVSLRYVKSPAELGNPDMIILPGTKNTMGDLLWLRQYGLEALIKKEAARETVIFGLCGGYQMLGKTLEDPYGAEQGGSMQGLGLLDCRTVFQRQKTRTRVSGRFKRIKGPLSQLSGFAFEGYEIHMGVTESDKGEKLTLIAGGKEDGLQNGNIFGSYIHGIFDQGDVAAVIAECLLRKKGLEPAALPRISFQEYKERQYEQLASAIRENIDLVAIKKIIEEGV